MKFFTAGRTTDDADVTDDFFNRSPVGRAVLCTPRLEADARTLAHEVRRARSDAPYLFVLSVSEARGPRDTEGKAAMGSGERGGTRASFKSVVGLLGRENF